MVEFLWRKLLFRLVFWNQNNVFLLLFFTLYIFYNMESFIFIDEMIHKKDLFIKIGLSF